MINRRLLKFLVGTNILAGALCWAQVGTKGAAPAPAQPVPPPAPLAPPPDSLGRDTPRGTVLGFLSASRKGDDQTAVRYLNTRLSKAPAATLAHKLAEVLNRRLPTRLNEVSNKPEGSLYNSDKPDTDLVGTVQGAEGGVDIIVERGVVGRSPIWLFSKDTLDEIPRLHDDVTSAAVERVIPKFLMETKIAQVALFQWLCIFVGMPLVYFLTGLLSRLLSPIVTSLWRKFRGRSDARKLDALPRPIRLVLLVLAIRWMLANISLPLLARQFWSSVAYILIIAAIVWLGFTLINWGEGYIERRMAPSDFKASGALLRLTRRTIETLWVFGGVLIALSHFEINLTAAVAGLGVGGIAFALAAQKTLENVVSGATIVLDRALQTGDTLRIGETLGTVEAIGLRSTRIRTLDRSVVVIPNGQVANVSIESLSSRDRFWFHPILTLHYETTPAQMREVLVGIQGVLAAHELVEPRSIRVRFLRFGPGSLDVDVFAYILSGDFPHFLEVQEDLLLHVMDVVHGAGTRLALPLQIAPLDPQPPVVQRTAGNSSTS